MALTTIHVRQDKSYSTIVTNFNYPDYPLIRAWFDCPLCGGGKDQGLLACWPCYRAFDLKNGDSEVKNILSEKESQLEARENG